MMQRRQEIKNLFCAVYRNLVRVLVSFFQRRTYILYISIINDKYQYVYRYSYEKATNHALFIKF